VQRWAKKQRVRAGKVTLWDYSFELPSAHLDAQATVAGRTVKVGTVDHALQVGGNQKVEIYDFPGDYAKRFDGVNPQGGDRPADLGHVYEDNRRTAGVRMDQEAVAGLRNSGTSTCWQFAAGQRFTLERHFNADGIYVLTRVRHQASVEGAYTTGQNATPLVYDNEFECIPFSTNLPFRPQRMTPKPKIEGPQTAVVTAAPGDTEDYFLDKYGRVKVQFPWDRQGQNDANSSCWVRVAQVWAGKKWGAFFWPRKGHEVVVAFEEGDPDRPLVIGSAYNAANMPPYDMPTNALVNGFKSCTYRQTASENFNAIFFIDQPGNEHVAFHSERNMTFDAELDKLFRAGRHTHEIVRNTRHFSVGGLPSPGAGGGGGSWDYPAPPPDAFTWYGVTTPDLGTNCAMTYGDNIFGVTGIYDQIYVGENVALVLNPFAVGAAKLIPKPAFWGLLGGALGGNMAFTMGLNTSVQWGQVFTINLGPGQLTTEAANHLPTQALAVIVCGLGIAWQIDYAIDYDFDARSKINDVYQAVIESLLVALVEVEIVYATAAGLLQEAFGAMFGSAAADEEKPGTSLEGWGLMPAERNVVSNAHMTAGPYDVTADQIRLVAMPASAPTTPPNFITLLAPGDGANGQVALRGSQGVRISAGPPDPMIPTEDITTTGIELQTVEAGKITMNIGIPPGPMLLMSSPVIGIDAGEGIVLIKSNSVITLSVADGASEIELTPSGVQIKGLQIQQLAELEVQVKTLQETVNSAITTRNITLQQNS
jgi:hypothetical protein